MKHNTHIKNLSVSSGMGKLIRLKGQFTNCHPQAHSTAVALVAAG